MQIGTAGFEPATPLNPIYGEGFPDVDVVSCFNPSLAFRR